MKIIALMLTLVTFLFLAGCSSDSNSPTAKDSGLLRAIENNDLQLFELIYGDKQYDKDKLIVINKKSNVDNTPLMFASFNRRKEIVALMLTFPIDVDKQNVSGDTALMLAAMRGENEIILALIDAGAQINAKSIQNNTALIYASAMGHPDTVRLLIKHGANKETRSNQLNGTAVEIVADVVSEENDTIKKAKYLEIYRFLNSLTEKK